MNSRSPAVAILLAFSFALAQPQAQLPAAAAVNELNTPTATANFVYQTAERAVVLLQQPTSLALTLLRDLGNRGVDLYLVCPIEYQSACRAMPNLAGLAVVQPPPKPMWILDGSTFLVSPYLDAGFEGQRSFAMTAKTAAQMLEEILAAFFSGS